MDHERIEREALVERYHRGDLSADEEALFEEHFFSCRQCQARLEAAQDFRDGLRDVAARDAAQAAADGIGASVAGAALASRRRWLWPAAALVLLAALPGWWLLFRDRDVVQDRVATVPESPPVEVEIAAPLEVPVFLLTTLRGGTEDGATVISAEQASGPLSLAVDAGDDPRFVSYRMSLIGPDGESVLRRDGLRQNALEVLMLTLPAGFLSPGESVLVVEGELPEGEAEEVGRYRFRMEG